MRHLDGLMRRVVQTGKPLAVLICDLDFFKRVNDTYGHAAGDDVLKQFALRAAGAVRNIDMVARFGGEEFMILMPDTDGQAALRAAERLCKRIGETPMVIDAAAETGITVTVSIGIAASAMEIPGEELIKIADAALYRAKQEGRNRAVIDPASALS
jgi:two-component system cell cycle response regulator